MEFNRTWQIAGAWLQDNAGYQSLFCYIVYSYIYIYICYFGRFTNSACWVYLFGSNQPATSATWQKTSAFSCWVCIHRAVYSKLLLLLLMILLFILVSRKACFVLVLVLVVVVDVNIVVHPGIQESLLCCCWWWYCCSSSENNIALTTVFCVTLDLLSRLLKSFCCRVLIRR